MAGCERGYLCVICGREVEEITESELYLRYVLGEVEADRLNWLPERHIRCNAALAQFIVAEGFDSPMVEGAFAKIHLDPEFVRVEERRVTDGYLRLVEVSKQRGPIWDYPLPEVRARRVAEAAPAESRTRSSRPGGPTPTETSGILG
jgi:hypothetical protein